MSIAYLGIGSNMGDPEMLLRTAVTKLQGWEGIHVTKCSSLYETDPIGYTEQDPFMNAVVEVVTDLTPVGLLAICNAIEQELGRERIVRWGPRTVDIDILLFGEVYIDTPSLTIPHPRLQERLFALIPLDEIAPDKRWDGETAKIRIARCGSLQGIIRLKPW